MTVPLLPRLYVVTNRHQTSQRTLRTVVQETLRAGTTFIQLREKDLNTNELVSLGGEILTDARPYEALLLINDRADVAKALKADGVHLRSDSLPVSHVRRFLGPQALIGKSTHSLQDVLAAESDGVDFIVLGPVYDTPSKKDYGPPLGIGVLEQVCQQSTLPIYAIGGITPKRVKEVKNSGAYGVAVISAVLESMTITAVTHQFLNALEET